MKPLKVDQNNVNLFLDTRKESVVNLHSPENLLATHLSKSAL